MRCLIIFLSILVSAAAANAETPLQQARALEAQGLAAYKANNFAEAAKDFAAALSLRPHHPGYLYNFAISSAQAGNINDAIRALNDYADLGLIADVEHKPGFAALRTLPAFPAIVDKIQANGKLVGESKIVARLTEPFLAEGIAYDNTGKRFFISSVDQRKIVQIAFDGTMSNFAPRADDDGLLGAFGMTTDVKRQILWVATSGVAHAKALSEIQRRNMEIVALSLQDGRRMGGEDITASDVKSTGVVGDLIVGPDGDAYATDSVLPRIYVADQPPHYPVAHRGIWLESDLFGSLQGITTTPDGASFIVADYAMGLHFIERATKAIKTIDFAGGTTLLGIDGLVRSGNTLLAVQNGIAPQRILALTLDATGRGIASVKVMSANDPNIPEPSLGVIKDTDFCVVANAQWSRFNDDGTRKQTLDPPRIACVALDHPGR